jgi:hypothetical protein
MAEGIQEIGREFVKKTIEFIDGSFGFDVFMDSYTARDAISFSIEDEKKVSFDIAMCQDILDITRNPAVPKKRYFICECKKRDNENELKPELKAFLINILKVTPHLTGVYKNCHFIFFYNKPFSVRQADIHNVEYVMDLLDNAYGTNEITALCKRIGMICLDDWFLELTGSGRHQ